MATMHETYTTYSTLASNDSLTPVYERNGLYAPKFALQSVLVGGGTGRGSSIPGGYGGTQGGATVGGNSTSGDISLSGGATDGPANMLGAKLGALDPFNMAVSPVLWAVIFLFVGIVGLRTVHWRG